MKIGLLVFELGMERNDVMCLFEYAQAADRLGFSRFWLGEHYDDPLNYWSNPEPLLPLLLGHTENINVGTAGILARLHSPFRVATNFRLLNSMFLGRVDLGLAGGYAKDPVVEALTGHSMEEFLAQDRYQNTQKIISYFREEAQHLEKGLFVNPTNFPAPNLWLLSFTYNGVDYAVESEANYSRTLFHSIAPKEGQKENVLRYKENFFEKHGREGGINIAFSGIIDKDRASAKKRFARTSYASNPFYQANLLGCKNEFYDRVMEMQEIYGVDEVIWLDMGPDMEHRQESLEIISEMFSSSPAAKAVHV